MLLILFLWLFIFSGIFVLGFSVVKATRILTNKNKAKDLPGFDQYYFFGFLSVAALTGIISVFIPIGVETLYSGSLLILVLFFINIKDIKEYVNELVKRKIQLRSAEIVFLSIILIFILTAAANKITLYDSGLYHIQSIKWIRSYPVVPGLGNIHARFALNSMFFVVSGLFTFPMKGSNIFPINSLCFVVLFFKLYSHFHTELTNGVAWKTLFYGLLILISLLVLLPDLNSPSPDIICSILIIYLFVIIINYQVKSDSKGSFQFILINMLAFSCISFKLSSILIVLSILLILVNRFPVKQLLIAVIVAALFLSSFFIRNYYLSGYLIYPFPAIDIFNVDWKIPVENVNAMKLEIEGWAKIYNLPYNEVVDMKITDWLLPWFKLLNPVSKVLVIINFISVFSFFIMLFKRDFFVAKLQLVVLLNLCFWFVMSPDPRFVYGFLFIGFSLTLSYFFKMICGFSLKNQLRFIKIVLAGFFIIVFLRRIGFPLEAFSNPGLLIIPDKIETVKIKQYTTNFDYFVPESSDQCYDTKIPCLPYVIDNVYMRGKEIKEGFKVIPYNILN